MARAHPPNKASLSARSVAKREISGEEYCRQVGHAGRHWQYLEFGTHPVFQRAWCVRRGVCKRCGESFVWDGPWRKGREPRKKEEHA